MRPQRQSWTGRGAARNAEAGGPLRAQLIQCNNLQVQFECAAFSCFSWLTWANRLENRLVARANQSARNGFMARECKSNRRRRRPATRLAKVARPTDERTDKSRRRSESIGSATFKPPPLPATVCRTCARNVGAICRRPFGRFDSAEVGRQQTFGWAAKLLVSQQFGNASCSLHANDIFVS